MTDVRDDQLPKGAGSADAVDAIPAASVIVLRGEPFEVLFMRRTSRSSFVPGAWVFPGGAVDPIDRELASRKRSDSDLDAMKICALRELFEESGIWLGESLDDPEATRAKLLDAPTIFRDLYEQCANVADRLVLTSRWITPIGVPKRFDTSFFLLEVEPDQDATPENREGVEVRWLRPAEALSMHERGELSLVFPTIRNLEAISEATSARDLIESRRGAEIRPVQPVLVVEGGRKKIVLPEEV